MRSNNRSGGARVRSFVGVFLVLALLAAACGGTTREEEAAQGDSPTAAGGDSEAAGDGASAAASEESTAAANPDAEIPEGMGIAFLPKQINNPYFTTASAGASAATEEFGGEYNETGPSDASASSQVSYINTLSQQGSEVILLSANDPNALCPSLEQARGGGSKVVTFDSDTAPECRDLFVNQATSDGIAEVQLQMVADQLEGGEGQVAILSATPNATNQNTWIEAMEGMIEENDAYSGIEIVTVAYGNDEDEKSFQEAQGLLQSYSDLDAIIAPTTVGIAAAARYISGSQYKGEVIVTGLGTPNQMREFVKDGTVAQFALWNPEELGYLAAWTGAALASGQITGQEGETFEAGELGEYEVGANGEVLLGPPTVFDENNIDDFDF
jgi:rhamnose transport system substrate-binding protein